MSDKNYQVIQGDSFILTFTYTDSTGAGINLTGGTITAEFRDKPGGQILSAVCTIGDGITVTSAIEGKLTLNVTPAKTRKFNFPKTAFQIQFISSGGNASTLVKGWIDVDAGVIP